MLKLVKRPKSPNWVMRGTVRGVSIEESTGVADRKAAEEIITKRQAEILTESVWGKTATIGDRSARRKLQISATFFPLFRPGGERIVPPHRG